MPLWRDTITPPRNRLVARGESLAALGAHAAALVLYDWALALNPLDGTALVARHRSLQAMTPDIAASA